MRSAITPRPRPVAPPDEVPAQLLNECVYCPLLFFYEASLKRMLQPHELAAGPGESPPLKSGGLIEARLSTTASTR